MKVYITFDWYDSGMACEIDQITTDVNEVRKVYKENLKKLLEIYPDDLHDYRIQCVDLPEETIDTLNKIIKTDKEPSINRELLDIMFDVVEIGNKDSKCILLETDGASDFYDVIELYMKETSETDEDDAEMLLADNEDLYIEYLDKHIENTYDGLI